MAGYQTSRVERAKDVAGHKPPELATFGAAGAVMSALAACGAIEGASADKAA